MGCRLARCVVGRVNDDVCWMVLVVRAQRSTEVDEIIVKNGDDGMMCALTFWRERGWHQFHMAIRKYLFTFRIKKYSD